ncbi:hypothetical protein KBX06_12490 [Micromonospora sp. C31]|uniref:BTAD domain-containing putative transcriptional regulator n=1 Tax=Micromonospora sp. C31 TaxID=2824876 RepID=UPI001B360B4D|nr:BTAD domain-containing putative transcriptional regulator [Micromonospora sp. C31]MBQ1073973.1 hypothetical protein [Micromonospora sp. C31]
MFGGVAWEVDGTPVPVAGRRRPLLLGLLLLRAPAPVALERIATALWPDRQPAAMRPAAQVQIHRLRRVLAGVDDGPRRIRMEAGGYGLDVTDLDLDVLAFRRDLREARRLVGEGRADVAADLLRRVVDLSAGPVLGGAYPSVAGWPEVRDLTRGRQEAIDLLARLDLAAGRAGGPCRQVRRLGVGPPAAGLSTGPARAVAARHALLRAADFAERMGGHGQAYECLRAVLATTGPEEPDRPALLLRLAEHRSRDTGTGAEEARAAYRLFADRGDRLGVVQAELTISRLFWYVRDGAAATRALTRARRRLGVVPLADWPVPMAASLVGMLAVTGQAKDGVDVAEAVVRRAGPPSPDYEWARLLGNRGLARLYLGHPAAVRDCQAAVDVHRASAGWIASSFAVNLMDATATSGDLRGYREVLEWAVPAARARGTALDLRHLEANLAWRDFWAGDLVAADRRVRRWLACEDGHFLTDRCLWLRGRLALLSGDRRGAAGVLERLAASTSQGSLWSAALYRPLLAAAVARRRRSSARLGHLVEEAVDVVGSGFVPAEVGVVLPALLRSYGMPTSLLGAAAPTGWREAAEAYVCGDRLRAAGLYRQIGSRPDERWCRRHDG